MKGVRIKDIENLKEWSTNLKNYQSLYSQAKGFAADKPWDAYEDILSAIESHADEILEDISVRLNEMYNSWSGKTELELTGTERTEAEDAIDEENESKEGICEYIIDISNEFSNQLYFTPVNFMKRFVIEFGIFKLDDSNNVVIL